MNRENYGADVEGAVRERLYFLHGEISMLSEVDPDEDCNAGFRRLRDAINETNNLYEWMGLR